jgi:hypothetical protein
MAKALIYKSLKGLKSLGIVWYLRVRTEGEVEFSRKFGGLKALKPEFEGSKVSDFLEN